MDKQTDERVQLRRLAALMGWAEFRVGSGEPVPPLDSVSWADEGDPWGMVVWRDADDEGAHWNPFTREGGAIERAEYLSREGSITDRLDTSGTWAPTLARAIALAALAAFGEA